MDQYNYENLSTILGDKVSIRDDQGNEVELTLKEVNKSRMDGNDWEAFSAIFTGDKTFRIPQGTYTFKHKYFGDKKIFISPNSETEYETVVTRARQKN